MFPKIHGAISIGEVQDRFNECFASLKLEVYSLSHK
jgi:hypothetical protein